MAAAARPNPQLAPVQAAFAGAITDIERGAVALRTQASRYQAIGGAPGASRARTAALRAMASDVTAMQNAYWHIAPLVLSNAALRSLDLGTQAPSANLRPDEVGQPLTQLGALLATVSASGSAEPVGPISPTALLSDVQLLLDRAGRLAVQVRAAAPTARSINGAVTTALELVAADGRAWGQSPDGPMPDANRAAATVAGLRRVLASLPAGMPAKSLQPAVANLVFLLQAAATPGGPRAIVGPELAWRATDLATRAARGDDAPGARAAAVERIEETLFRARWDLALGRTPAATSEVATAEVTLRQDLGPLTAGDAPAALTAAAAAVRQGDPTALAAARGRATAAMMVGAYRLTLTALAERNAASAQGWAAVRDLGPSASGGVGDEALGAIGRFAAGSMTAAQASLSVQRDELDGLQRRDVALVGQTSLDRGLRLPSSSAEAGALAAGYWSALAPIYAGRVNPAASRSAHTEFAQLGGTTAATLTASLAASQALGAFTAAPATELEQEQRIRQLVTAVRFTLTRSCSLTPSATPAAQLPGTVSGPPLVRRLINDLRPGLTAAQSARLNTAETALAALPGAAGVSGEELAQVKQLSPAVKRNCLTVSDQVQAVFGGAWRSSNENGDFDRIDDALTRASAAAARGDWQTALASARASYAIFDVTTELGLRAVEPALATHIEALYWNGSNALIARVSGRARAAELNASFSRLRHAYLQARVALDSSHSGGAVAVNSAIIVLREGLEALLVIAALGSGFIMAGPRWRRPVIAGALAAFPATVVTWLVAGRAVTSLASYGLRLQAVLDVVSLAVLAVILGWFFQKYCWTRFVARENARRKRLLGRGTAGGALRPILGLAAVGFMVVYREGFETVLFLQSAKSQAGSQPVIVGVLLGSLVTGGIGILMLLLRRRLPYRRIVVAAAVMVSIIAVALSGQTVRSLQAVGWVGIAPVPIGIPAWAGLWLGLYASVQTLGAQAAAIVAILLGRVVSDRLRARRLAKRLRTMRATNRKAPAARASANGKVPAALGSRKGKAPAVHAVAKDPPGEEARGRGPRVALGPRS